MRFSTFASSGLCLVSAVYSHNTKDGQSSDLESNGWEKLDLEAPLNWLAGRRLFPAFVSAGYNAEYDEYDCVSWANHVLDQCKQLNNTDSTLSFSAINSGTPKERYWFGYCFGGGPTTQNDYRRGENVEDSTVFNRIGQ